MLWALPYPRLSYVAQYLKKRRLKEDLNEERYYYCYSFNRNWNDPFCEILLPSLFIIYIHTKSCYFKSLWRICFHFENVYNQLQVFRRITHTRKRKIPPILISCVKKRNYPLRWILCFFFKGKEYFFIPNVYGLRLCPHASRTKFLFDEL